MKKLLLPLLAFLLCIRPAAAQTRTTSVSIGVTDAPDGQAWANGSYTTALVIVAGTSTATSSPGPSGVLDGSGNATFSLTSQNDITFPTGGQWQVTVCPAMGCAVASYSQLLPGILGSTQSFSLTPPSFRENVYSGRPANAYRDSEVISSVLGSEYFNMTTGGLKYCVTLPCTWSGSNPGTVSSVTGTANQITIGGSGSAPVVRLANPILTDLNPQQCVDGTINTTVQGAMTGAGANGLACVPTTDGGTDIPAGTRISSQNTPTLSAQPNGVHLQDFRFGESVDFINNSAFDNQHNAWSARQMITNWNEPLGNAISSLRAELTTPSALTCRRTS